MVFGAERIGFYLYLRRTFPITQRCMKRHRITLVFLGLFASLIAFSQPTTINFSSVDSFVKIVKYKGNLDSLTKRLTAPYSEQLFKARAIFKWVTENIRYDFKYYNKYNYKGKEPKTYKCRDSEDCEAKKIAWEIKYIDKVLRKKKAVCQGYSMLFKKMCDIARLRSEVIAGYTRTEYYQVGTSGSLDHAWNSIWIECFYHTGNLVCWAKVRRQILIIPQICPFLFLSKASPGVYIFTAPQNLYFCLSPTRLPLNQPNQLNSTRSTNKTQ